MCAQGAGVGILPDNVAKAHEQLHPIWPTIKPFDDIHALIYRADLQCSTAAKGFARALVQAVTESAIVFSYSDHAP